MRVVAAISLLLAAPAAARATEVPPPAAPETAPPPPAATPPEEPPAAPPAEAGGAEPAAPAADAPDAEFEPAARTPSIALGPARRGEVTLSLDVGWLKSGFRADLGLGDWLDLVFAADTLLLYDGFHAQSGIHVGLRASPFADGLVRAAAELSVGEIFAPGEVTLANFGTVKGQALLGLALDWATVYARGQLRGLAGGFQSDAGWTRDEELGLGVEHVFRRNIVVGAEVYVWARPELADLTQWRLRIGYAR